MNKFKRFMIENGWIIFEYVALVAAVSAFVFVTWLSLWMSDEAYDKACVLEEHLDNDISKQLECLSEALESQNKAISDLKAEINNLKKEVDVYKALREFEKVMQRSVESEGTDEKTFDILNYGITEDEFEMLCRITEAEATGGTIEQKRNVASCILNRVNSSDWPNTIEGVIFQNNGKVYQFSPISDGRYYSVVITDETKEAVQLTLEEGILHDCIFFCSYGCKSSWFASKGEPDFKDGIHRYYRH